MAKECGNVSEHVRHLAGELWKPGIASGLLRKSFQLIFPLQVIHASHAAHSTVHVSEVLIGTAQTNAENRDVTLAELLHGLIERVFGESVHAAGQQDDGLLALYILQAIHSFEYGVEHVRFAESREIEMIEPLHHFVFILREVHFETGFHVKGLERDPVFRLQTGEKRRGPILPDIRKKTTIAVAAELEKKDHGDRSVGGSEVGDGLRHAVVEYAKIFFLETRDDVAVLRGGDDIERDDGNIDSNGDAGLRRLLRRSGRLR